MISEQCIICEGHLELISFMHPTFKCAAGCCEIIFSGDNDIDAWIYKNEDELPDSADFHCALFYVENYALNYSAPNGRVEISIYIKLEAAEIHNGITYKHLLTCECYIDPKNLTVEKIKTLLLLS